MNPVKGIKRHEATNPANHHRPGAAFHVAGRLLDNRHLRTPRRALAGLIGLLALLPTTAFAAPCNFSSVRGTWLITAEEDVSIGVRAPEEPSSYSSIRACWLEIRGPEAVGFHCPPDTDMFRQHELDPNPPWHAIRGPIRQRRFEVDPPRAVTAPNRCEWVIYDKNGHDLDYQVWVSPDRQTLVGVGFGIEVVDGGYRDITRAMKFNGVRQ